MTSCRQHCLASRSGRHSQRKQTDTQRAGLIVSLPAVGPSCAACNLTARRAGLGYSPPPPVVLEPKDSLPFSQQPSTSSYSKSAQSNPILWILPTQCICVFCVDLRTNSDYFPIQH
jgi:hypothetical protein